MNGLKQKAMTYEEEKTELNIAQKESFELSRFK